MKVVFRVRRVKFLCYVETVAPGFVAESAVDVSPGFVRHLLYRRIPKARLFINKKILLFSFVKWSSFKEESPCKML